MRRIFFSAALLAVSLGVPSMSASTISLTDTQRVALVRLVATDSEAGKLFRKIEREADAALPDEGNPVASIRTAGLIAGNAAKLESQSSLGDMRKLYALGYAWAATSRGNYAAAARRVILRWAEVNQPTGSPIDETKLSPLFVAYDLTRSEFSGAERGKVDGWLRNMAAMELQSARTNSITASNNWNSHRLKIVGQIGFLLQDTNLIDKAVRGYRSQIAANLRPDGSSLDFHHRDALHYHCYNLEPLLTLALTARMNGIDLYNYEAPGGASLPKAVKFLLPYCDGSKTHAEWVNTKNQFDRQRAEAGEAGFAIGTPFEPRDARRVMELASFFDESYGPTALRLYSSKALLYPGWESVLNRARH